MKEEVTEKEISSNFSSIKFPTLVNETLIGAINEIMEHECRGYKPVKEIEDPDEFIDILTKAFWAGYVSWRKRQVRSEMGKIQPIFKGKTMRCRRCGRLTNKIEVHHIIPVGCCGGNERNNVTFLCHECHKIENKESFENAEQALEELEA